MRFSKRPLAFAALVALALGPQTSASAEPVTADAGADADANGGAHANAHAHAMIEAGVVVPVAIGPSSVTLKRTVAGPVVIDEKRVDIPGQKADTALNIRAAARAAATVGVDANADGVVDDNTRANVQVTFDPPKVVVDDKLLCVGADVNANVVVTVTAHTDGDADAAVDAALRAMAQAGVMIGVNVNGGQVVSQNIAVAQAVATANLHVDANRELPGHQIDQQVPFPLQTGFEVCAPEVVAKPAAEVRAEAEAEAEAAADAAVQVVGGI